MGEGEVVGALETFSDEDLFFEVEDGDGVAVEGCRVVVLRGLELVMDL